LIPEQGEGDMEIRTDAYQSLFAETIVMPGHRGELINAYFARPTGSGPFPGIVLVHHMPGWDEWYHEAVHRFAYHGYAAISPNLYYRFGHGTAEDVASRARAAGGVPDDQAVGDLSGALKFLASHPAGIGKVAVFGTCSGGRHGYLAACKIAGFSALIDCWGGRIVVSKEELTPKQPVAPLDFTDGLSCPLLGLFGNEDSSPSPQQVNIHEEELKRLHKEYEFHRYPGAGHGFFYYHRPAYRPEAAVDGWQKIFNFLERKLS
jgi:carboxymethylenebutenolidase